MRQKSILNQLIISLIFFTITIMISFFTSCVSSKEIRYMQTSDSSKTVEKPFETEYNIQPLDLLYINVNSLNDKAMKFFETQGNKGGYMQNEQSLFLSGFEVGIDGYLKLPYLDSLYVLGKTLTEVKSLITDGVKEYIEDAVVNIRLINFKVCVFGEVQNSGTFSFYNNRVTIFDAIAASRPTDFANKKNVIITRLLPNGELSIRRIDLTKHDIIKSDFYYLKPHDQLYFEPLKVKQYGFSNAPYSLILSVITVTFLILNNLK